LGGVAPVSVVVDSEVVSVAVDSEVVGSVSVVVVSVVVTSPWTVSGVAV
jgi:hypothetical protein